MLKITPAAEQKVASLIQANDKEIAGLRVVARARSPFKVDYRLAFTTQEQVKPQDSRLPFSGFNVYVDPESEKLLDRATVDYVEGVMGSGFKIDREDKVPAELKGTLAERVLTVIEEQINPAVASHGGHVTLMDVQESVVYVELGGGCQGCGMAKVTLKQGIEKMIREALPEVTEVVDITDHALGSNPYYDKEAE
ncbi:MAG: NifU family protein [Candidatus Latescibacterota bacterium]